MITRFVPSHSHLVDPKSSLGQKIRPFKFGMQAVASRYFHPFKAMMAVFLLSLSRPMDPKSFLGQKMGLGCKHWHRDTPTPSRQSWHVFRRILTWWIPNHLRVMFGIIQFWDASTGIGVLPYPQIAADDAPAILVGRSCQWLININTGCHIGALPVGAIPMCYSGQVRGSIYVGWTMSHKLVLIHFPVQ